MAYTQEQLSSLRQAIAEGVTKVAANGRTVEYRSLDEMRQVERIMAAEVEGTASTPKRIYASFRGI